MGKTGVEINTSDYGSTGNIMLQIADCGERNGFSVYTVSRKWKGKQTPKHAKHLYDAGGSFRYSKEGQQELRLYFRCFRYELHIPRKFFQLRMMEYLLY